MNLGGKSDLQITMLQVVTKIHGQRVQRLEDGDQHQGQRQRGQLSRVQLVPNRLEEFQLRGGAAQVQAGIGQALRRQQFAEQSTLGEQLTAERAADVDDAVVAVADLFGVTGTGFGRATDAVQLQQVKIVQAERSLLPVRRQSRWMWWGWRWLWSVQAGWQLDAADVASRHDRTDGLVDDRFVVRGALDLDEDELGRGVCKE